MINPTDRIEELAKAFVGQLVQVARDLVIESLNGVGGGGGEIANGATKSSQKSPKASKRVRAKFEKRDSAEIDRMQTKVFAFIEKHPKLRVEEINAAMRTNTKQLALPLKKLVASGALKTTGSRRATRYSVGKKSSKKSK